MACESRLRPGAMSAAAGKAALPAPLVVAYTVFVGGAVALYHLVASDAISAILTVAEMLKCLAVALLAAQVLCLGDVRGISANALGMHALGLCCRLSSTTWLNGYLPVDVSGDWFYQTVDVVALGMELWLIHQVVVARRDAYQHEKDTFPVAPVVLGAFLLATLFHSDMNARPVFDTLWMAGLFLCTAAVLPQLWFISNTSGQVEALTSHHIAAMALGTALSGLFMFYARQDITCEFWVDGINHAIIAILAAHLLHLLLLGDFAYYYLRAVAVQGLGCRLDFEDVVQFV